MDKQVCKKCKRDIDEYDMHDDLCMSCYIDTIEDDYRAETRDEMSWD